MLVSAIAAPSCAAKNTFSSSYRTASRPPVLLLRAFRLGAALLLLGGGFLPLRPLEGPVDALLRPGVDVAARVAESAVAVEEAQAAEEEAYADARFGVVDAFEEFDVFQGVGEE